MKRPTQEDIDRLTNGWRCPTESWLDGKKCGHPATMVTSDVTDTYIYAKTEGASRLLAFGIDPGPPDTEVRPVAYEVTYTCAHGHEHYIETRPIVRKS